MAKDERRPRPLKTTADVVDLMNNSPVPVLKPLKPITPASVGAVRQAVTPLSAERRAAIRAAFNR